MSRKKTKPHERGINLPSILMKDVSTECLAMELSLRGYARDKYNKPVTFDEKAVEEERDACAAIIDKRIADLRSFLTEHKQNTSESAKNTEAFANIIATFDSVIGELSDISAVIKNRKHSGGR